MELTDAVVVTAYAAMALELAFVSVPSVVSTRQRLRRPEAASAGAKIATVLPILLILTLFLLPLIAAAVPGFRDGLIPIAALSTPAVRFTGVGLLVFGKVLTPLSVPPLRRAIATDSLARSGVFARSRHPGLVGMFAFYLGAALIYPSVVLLAGFPFYLRYMHRRALMEEAHLRARFPHEYAKYAMHVPRYLGITR
jgi:protein-S-isoprenylcysteine O-methyltransferase Ste14